MAANVSRCDAVAQFADRLDEWLRDQLLPVSTAQFLESPPDALRQRDLLTSAMWYLIEQGRARLTPAYHLVSTAGVRNPETDLERAFVRWAPTYRPVGDVVSLPLAAFKAGWTGAVAGDGSALGYRTLLLKYMRHIEQECGSVKLGGVWGSADFTDEELDILEQLAMEIDATNRGR